MRVRAITTIAKSLYKSRPDPKVKATRYRVKVVPVKGRAHFEWRDAK